MSRPESAIGTWKGIWLVARREIAERLRTKSFYIATGLLVLVILAVGAVAQLTGDDESGAVVVGVPATAPEALGDVLSDAAGADDLEATVEAFEDEDGARTLLEDGDVDVVIFPAERQVLFAEAVDDQTFAIIQQAWTGVEIEQALSEAGLTGDQISEALAPIALEATSLDGEEDELSGLTVLIGSAAAVMLFGSIQMFGAYVLTGVVEEKATAVVEVVLVRASAEQILAGKVIGIGAAGLIQFAVAVVAAMVSLMISGVDVPSEVWGAVPTTLLWFLGGYALYSTLFALAGSLVSRQEDAQAASTPVTSVLVASYVAVFFVGFVPQSTASTVMSLIPPIAPFLMPMRMAAGAASTVEVVAAIVIMLVTIVAVWKISARIFEQVLLRRGTRISWGDATALFKARS